MEVVRAPCRSRRAAPQCYAGDVWIDRDVSGLEPSRLQAFGAHFGPGARTAWHRHPYGEIVHVLHGVGRVQRRGGPVHEVHAGDTIVVATGEWHWYGAAPNAFVAVMSVHETDPQDGKAEWGEHVTDAEYLLPPSGMILPRQTTDRTVQREACW